MNAQVDVSRDPWLPIYAALKIPTATLPPATTSLADRVALHARQRPYHPAMEYLGVTLSYGELELWANRMSDHADATITGTPTLGGGQLYVPVSSLEVVQAGNPAYPCCTFRGSVVAVDPATGAEKWRAYTAGQPVPQGKTADGTQILGAAKAIGKGAAGFAAGQHEGEPQRYGRHRIAEVVDGIGGQR